MTTITTKPNLCTYGDLNVKARMKAFREVKEIHLDELSIDFVDEIMDKVTEMGLAIEDAYFGWDLACTCSLHLSYPDKKACYLKGARSYAFIWNHMFNCYYHKYFKRGYRVNMVQEKNWMMAYEYHVLKNAWESFKQALRSGKNPSVQDFIYMLRDEYIQEWVTRSKYYDDEAEIDANAKGYKFDRENGDLYFYDPVA